MNKQAFIAIDKANDAFIRLELYPQVIHTFIKEFKLDDSNVTTDDMMYLGSCRKELFALLSLIQYEIWETKKKLEALYDDKSIEEEAKAAEKIKELISRGNTPGSK